MRRLVLSLFFMFAAAASWGAEPILIIYNAGFALIRQPIDLDLHAGENEVRTSAVTRSLDPASVILRDASGSAHWTIVEQRFRSEPMSERAMLERMEGQTIPFRWHEDGQTREVPGKVVRADAGSQSEVQPIIEVDGKVQFSLPGTAIFPRLPDDAVLKPELRWRISTSDAVKTEAELSYLTEGLGWTADYNAVMRSEGTIAEFTGWITLKNETHLDFPPAQVKLVAGDVKRIRSEEMAMTERVIVTGSYIPTGAGGEAAVQTRRLDEYHEFSLPRAVVLPAGETTQVELVRAADVTLTRSFVYDGANLNLETTIYDAQMDAAFGTDSNSKVLITSEFKNELANHLGMPLPKGRLHFYRDNGAGSLQFTGDSAIDNTAQGELVRAVTGNAFDLIGERRQTDFRIDEQKRTADESFQIKVRNQRKEPVEVRVIEHPARWRQWEITSQSIPAKKIDGRTVEFRLPVKAGEEGTLTYSVRYSQFPRPHG